MGLTGVSFHPETSGVIFTLLITGVIGPTLQGTTPQKFDIDTKNGHFQKESPFPTHHFESPS